jgi:hypothetical protein
MRAERSLSFSIDAAVRAREDVGGASRFGNDERISRFRIALLMILRRGG